MKQCPKKELELLWLLSDFSGWVPWSHWMFLADGVRSPSLFRGFLGHLSVQRGLYYYVPLFMGTSAICLGDHPLMILWWSWRVLKSDIDIHIYKIYTHIYIYTYVDSIRQDAIRQGNKCHSWIWPIVSRWVQHQHDWTWALQSYIRFANYFQQRLFIEHQPIYRCTFHWNRFKLKLQSFFRDFPLPWARHFPQALLLQEVQEEIQRARDDNAWWPGDAWGCLAGAGWNLEVEEKPEKG